MATTTTDNSLLKDKKILEYPIGLGAKAVDDNGVPNQLMMININTSIKSSPLRSDGTTGELVSSTAIGTGVASTSPESNNEFVNPDTRALFGDEAVQKASWVKKTGMSRLDKTIILPMPNDYVVNASINYNQDYDPSSLSKMGDMLANANGAMAEELLRIGVTRAATGAINSVKSGLTTGDQLFAADKLVINDKKEVIFRDFGFRKFSFQFTLAPKSKAESDSVREIIETFRYYSLPELMPGKQFYIFPAEFEISFILGDKLNTNIPRITTSVLERVGINYSPGGNIWSTLPNGAPVAMNMTLEFLELEKVDRTRVWTKDQPIRSGY